MPDRTFTAGLVLDGRYRLERPLGEGGMGTIWVGHQVTLGREVAIKALKPGRGDDHTRLEREARLLASVRHPAIIQIFDFGRTHDGLAYVVMELLRGPSLEAHLGSHGTMSCEDAVSLLLPVLDGLACVHAAGIVHRDIKPANILLALEGAGGAARVVPKLLDFGIAKSHAASALTIEGDLVGTPDYMAPEQFVGVHADARSDVWAIGATLYDMIAGEPPFTAPNLFAIMQRAREEPPAFPRHARGIDGKLWTLLTETLRKDPAQRPQSALFLRQRLTDWLAARGGPRDPMTSMSSLAPSSLEQQARAPAPVLSPPVTPPEAPTESIPPERPSFDALIKKRLGDG